MPTPTNATVLNYPTSEIEFACVRVTITSPKLRQYTASTEIHLDQRKYDDLVEAERLRKRLSELKPGTEEHRACMLNLERANDRARIIREQISLDIAWSLCRFIGSETWILSTKATTYKPEEAQLMVTIEARFDFAENGLFGDIHDAIEQAIEVFNGLGEARVKAWSLMPKSTTTTERK